MERLRAALPLLVVLAFFALLLVPTLSPDVQLFYRDTSRLYYPVKRFIAEEISAGRLPFWYPWSESGTSLLGQVTPGLLHPFTLLYEALPFELAFKLNHLLALPLAALGAFLLCRRVGATPWAAAAGGIIYGGCGFLASMAASNLPFALGAATVPLAIERGIAFVRAPTPLTLLLAGGALALCAYAGEPQSMLFAGLLGGTWLVLEGAVQRRAPRALALVACWGACALLFSAPASFPAALRLARSGRSSGVSPSEQAMFSVAPARLLGYLVPEAFDDPSLPPPGAPPGWKSPYREYLTWQTLAAFSDSITIGPAPVLLALFALGAGRKGRLLLLGATVLALASTGDALGMNKLLTTALPVLRIFRYAEKFAGPTSLAVAVAAALGIDVALCGTRRAALLLLGSSAALAALCFLLALVPASSLTPWLIDHGATHSPAAAEAFLLALQLGLRFSAGVFGALTLAAFLRVRLQRARLLAAMVCAASAVQTVPAHLQTLPLEAIRERAPLAAELFQRGGPSPGRWRLFTNTDVTATPWRDELGERAAGFVGVRRSLLPQFDVIERIESASQYFTVGDGRYVTALLSAPEAMFAILGIRFALLHSFDVGRPLARAKNFAPLPLGYWLAEFPQRPRGWLVGRADAVDDADALLLLERPDFDSGRTCSVPREAATLVAELISAEPVEGRTALRRASSDLLLAKVNASRPALLVVSEHFDEGWSATVDGEAAPVVRADLTVLGVPVPGGDSIVRLRFVPRGLLLGVAALLATLGALLVWRTRTAT